MIPTQNGVPYAAETLSFSAFSPTNRFDLGEMSIIGLWLL